MKRNYQTPQSECLRFHQQNIVAASGVKGVSGNSGIGFGGGGNKPARTMKLSPESYDNEE